MRPLRVHILSDLHLETGPIHLPLVDADITILAGDIDTGCRGIEWAARTFPDRPVLYVIGNHEYYGETVSKLRTDLRRAAAGTNVHVLECEAVEFERVIFLGCTLWTDFQLFGDVAGSTEQALEQLADFREIRVDERPEKLTPATTLRWHAQSLRWLKANIPASRERTTVVVTHHAPSFQSIAAQFKKSLASAGFASRLDPLIEQSDIALWIHGHTHTTSDYYLGRTRLICNPRGPATKPVVGFRPDLVLEV
jgi:Icc-related predicted phosphoesterase